MWWNLSIHGTLRATPCSAPRSPGGVAPLRAPSWKNLVLSGRWNRLWPGCWLPRTLNAALHIPEPEENRSAPDQDDDRYEDERPVGAKLIGECSQHKRGQSHGCAGGDRYYRLRRVGPSLGSAQSEGNAQRIVQPKTDTGKEQSREGDRGVDGCPHNEPADARNCKGHDHEFFGRVA